MSSERGIPALFWKACGKCSHLFGTSRCKRNSGPTVSVFVGTLTPQDHSSRKRTLVSRSQAATHAVFYGVSPGIMCFYRTRVVSGITCGTLSQSVQCYTLWSGWQSLHKNIEAVYGLFKLYTACQEVDKPIYNVKHGQAIEMGT